MRPQRTLRQREGATATAHVVDCKFQHRACPSARPRHAAPWVRSVPGTEAFRSTVPLGRLAPQIARKIQYGLYTLLRTLKTASQEDRRDNKVAKLQYFTWVHYQETVLVQVVTLKLKPLVVASGHEERRRKQQEKDAADIRGFPQRWCAAIVNRLFKWGDV